MKIELSEEDAQKLINSQRTEINQLKSKLNKIREEVTRMIQYEGKLPEEFLKAATDLCGRYFGERVNETFLEEMRELYQQELSKKPYDRSKYKLFSVPFLFAAIGDDPYKMSNIRFNLRTVLETCGGEVPDWLKNE